METAADSSATMHSSMAKTIIAANSGMVYGTTAQEIGTRASRITPERPVLHGFNGKFSNVSASRIL